MFVKIKNWVDFSKWVELDRLAFASAIRTVAASLIPLIVAGLLGQPGFGLLMTLAGLNVSRTDPGGPYRAKALAMGSATLGVAITAFLATGFSTYGWWTAPLMFVVAFGCGFAGGFGNTAFIVSFAFIQIFVIAVALPGGGWAAAPERFFASILGGLWAMFLVLGVWPLRPEKPIKVAVADYYDAIADFIREICKVSAETTNLPELSKKQIVARNVQSNATDFLIKSRASRQGASRLSRNLLALAAGAGELLDMAVRLSQELETAPGQKYFAQVWPQIEETLGEMGEVTAQLAGNIRMEWGETDLENLEKFIKAFDETVTKIRLTASDLEADYTTIVDLRNMVYALNTMTDTLRTAAEIAEDLDESVSGNTPKFNISQFERRDLGELWDKIRDNLTLHSLIFRHAFRLALIMALAVLFYLALFPDHGYWVTLTIVVILKPDFGGTIERAYSRVIGTVIGGIIGAVLAATIHFDPLIYLLMAILGVLAFSQLPNNYGLFVVFLTPFVIFLIDLSQPGNWEIAALRILLTLLGGIMALAACYLFVPGWQRRFLPEQLARTIEANRAYFLAVMEVYLGQPLGSTGLLKAREQAHIETANAEAAFQQMLAEPKHQQANVTPFYALVTYNRHFLDSVTIMAAHLQNFSGQHQLTGLAEYTGRMDSILEKLEEAVREGVHPGPPPTLDDNWQAIQASMRQWSSRRLTELKANRAQTGTIARQAILDFTTVSRILERLSQDVSMMYREQNQISR